MRVMFVFQTTQSTPNKKLQIQRQMLTEIICGARQKKKKESKKKNTQNDSSE